MADFMPAQSHQLESHASQSSASEHDSGTATLEPPAPAVRPAPRTAPPRVDHLPKWKVLLHNDDVNEIGYVVETIVELIAMNPLQALLQTLEAHRSGVALLCSTHREHAELVCEQFASKKLTVTIEPDR